MKKLSVILILFVTLLSGFPSLSFAFFPEKSGHPKPAFESVRFGEFHNDSLHRIDFRYADRKRGIKPLIIPAVLIAGGTVFNYSDQKYDAQEWVWKNHNYQGSADDYLRFGPVAGLYALNALGVKAQNNIGNQSAILVKSLLLNTVITRSLKIFSQKSVPPAIPVLSRRGIPPWCLLRHRSFITNTEKTASGTALVPIRVLPLWELCVLPREDTGFRMCSLVLELE